MNKKNQYTVQQRALLILVASLLASCADLVTIDLPKNQLADEAVFASTATTNAVLAGVYSGMTNVNSNYYGLSSSITALTGLSSDELTDYSGSRLEFNENSLIPSNLTISALWDESYRYIYTANSAIEGLEKSNMEQSLKNNYIGEAKFVRAFCYLNLTNLFGDVPLIMQTDYKSNATIKRTPKETVYTQIVDDLRSSELLLLNDYSIGKTERVRPNRSAATALLARVYLYSKNYSNAVNSATSVIENPLYALEDDLNNVFLANGTESILQFIPESGYTYDASFFILTSSPSNVALTDVLVNSFEPNDQRLTNWIGSVQQDGTDYFFPNKYKNQSSPDYTEYVTVLRLAEQYLIRAEANAHQNKLNEAITDLNVLRHRAGLPDLDNSLSQEATLRAVERERQTELFAEGGHRWFDLKRTPGFADPTKSRAEEILSTLKGSFWQSTDALYPIPQTEVSIGSLEQNIGYQ